MDMRERELVSGMSVFVAVVEGGSLAAAARKTRLTPSAVSKHMARLEQRLGTRLLRRTTRSMTLTDAGRTFFERTSTILDDLRGVEQEVTSQNAAAQGLVRVSAPLLLGQTRVVPILLAFQKKVPAVSLDLDLTDRAVDMVGERIDVAVRITSEPPPSFVARRVGVVRRVLCASPAYLKEHPAPQSPRDLERHACLLLSGPSSSPFWHFRSAAKATRAAKAESVRVNARLRATNTLSLYDAAKAGLGIAELPRHLVDDDLRARRLLRVLDQFEPAGRDVYVIYPPTRFQPARVRELVNHLVPALEKSFRG
jgi:LysR family transcriptional regulator, transcriptional activator for dmlA